MRSDISLVLNVLLLLFTRGQSSSVPPVYPPSHADTSPPPDHVTEDPGNEILTRTRDPVVGGETSAETTSTNSTTTGPATITDAAFPTHLLSTSVAAPTPARTDAAVVMTTDTGPASSAAAAHGLSSTPTPPSSTPLHLNATAGIGTIQATEPLATEPHATEPPATTFSSASTSSSARASTSTTTAAQETQSESQTTGRTLTPAPDPVGPKHQEVPSELNVGDEDLMGPPYHPSSPLDPLLAGLLTVFIITTAVVFVVLFLKLRQRTTHPEFHRLQDLPMDDLMEDTPLSRYPY